MNRIKDFWVMPLVIAYGLVFSFQQKNMKGEVLTLQPIALASFLKATRGYLHHLTAEISFVQSAVYLGGIQDDTPADHYAPTLAHNYKQISKLYPKFQDPYYYTQSYLAHVGPQFTSAANEILSVGQKSWPANHIYAFFIGFNYFNYLEEPLKAAAVFREASKVANAPPMFAHLAAILPAEGGELEAAILALNILLTDPAEDKSVKERYMEELRMFHQVRQIQDAVNLFYQENNYYPEHLTELIPQYIVAIPSFGSAFDLTWKAPLVGLKRPRIKLFEKQSE